ncbi:MAG: T9SS type A sorting domain-containing protein [Paludibacter sp.]|nr:T9SS type A sorting domain-containing protein [Paludibacter sp.]
MKNTTHLIMFLLIWSVMNVAAQTTLTRNLPNYLSKASSSQLNAGEYHNIDAMTALKNFESSRRMVLQSKNPASRARLIKQMSGDMQQVLASQTTTPKSSFIKKQPLRPKTAFDTGAAVYSLQKKLNRSIYESAFRNKIPQAGVMKYRMDSIVNLTYDQSSWIKDSKQVFNYHYNGKMTKNANFEYLPTGNQWVNDDESTITYDDKGRMTGYLSKWWDAESVNPRWVINDSIRINYDSNGNKLLDERYYESFDQDSGRFVLMGDYKSEFTYSPDNEETGSIFYSWDVEAGEWVPESKHEIRIENGMELMFAGYMWNPELNMWIGHWKFENFPVPGYNMMGSVFYGWNNLTNEWYVNSKEEYEISQNESGTVITSIYSQSDSETMVLYPFSKTVYSEPVASGNNMQQSFRSIVDYSWNPSEGIWVNRSKTRNTFDGFGNLVLEIDSVWTLNNAAQYEWVIEQQIESIVNTAGKITETISMGWEYNMLAGTNTLVRKDKQVFVYNANNEVTERINQKWDFSSEKWLNINKNAFVYDSAGNMITELYYESYISESQTWVAARKFEYVYNSKGDQISYAHYNWIASTNSWRLGTKTEYEENDKGEVILDSYTSWNDFLNKEVINYKQQKVYDNNGNLVLELSINSNVYYDGTQYYITVYGDKQEYIYDVNNRLTSQIWYDYMNDVFVQEEKIDYVYDATHPGAMATETSYDWNAVTSTWDLNAKGELTYNFEVPRSELLLPFEEEQDASREVQMYFNYMPLEFTGSDWNAATTSWQLSEKTIVYFTYSEFSSTGNIDVKKVVVYPNPVADYLSVKLPADAQQAQFKLIDMQGRVVNEKTLTNETQVDLSDVVKGIYFYQIATGLETINGKLIKK